MEEGSEMSGSRSVVERSSLQVLSNEVATLGPFVELALPFAVLALDQKVNLRVHASPPEC
jgi:hypothetical protein